MIEDSEIYIYCGIGRSGMFLKNYHKYFEGYVKNDKIFYGTYLNDIFSKFSYNPNILSELKKIRDLNG
jgi:hypothetical protein